MVIDLSEGACAHQYQWRFSKFAPNVSCDACRKTELWLRHIPAGAFAMGSPPHEIGRLAEEFQHKVILTQDFFLGIFPCTQRQYELVMGSNPSLYKGDVRPVERVSYAELRGNGQSANWPLCKDVDEGSFFARLSEKTGLRFDLPTKHSGNTLVVQARPQL
jgi:formylglycine-generating enzyme required for sulfatase activity